MVGFLQWYNVQIHGYRHLSWYYNLRFKNINVRAYVNVKVPNTLKIAVFLSSCKPLESPSFWYYNFYMHA